MGKKLGLSKRECLEEGWWGDPNPHFCSFFINILHPTIFLMVFLNSFWGFQKQFYKTKLINKAHSIVWFERRHRLMCSWLISICCSNVWFAEFPVYRKENPAPCAQTLANPAALVEQISSIFPNPTLYFGQIPDPENTTFRPCYGRQLRHTWKTKDFQGVCWGLYFSRYFWDSGEEQWKTQGTGLDVSVKKSVNMYHVPGQIMG